MANAGRCHIFAILLDQPIRRDFELVLNNAVKKMILETSGDIQKIH